MSNLSLCRVCLASNTRMHHIANTRYHEIFEKLSTKLCTEDRRPETVCCICFSQLQKCCRFMDMSRKAEEILTQFSLSGIELSEETFTILDRKFVYKLSWTPLQVLSINAVEGCDASVVIKEEPKSTVTNIKVEKVDDNEPITRDKQVIGKFNVKEEIISESEGDNENQLTDREKVTVKEEQIKRELMEYEGNLEAEFELESASEEKYYKEVGITNPEPTERAKHACKHCDRSYKQRCHLNRHLKIHKAMEYTCEMCGKSFAQKTTLKKHLFMHSGVKPYACSLCPIQCTQKIDLNRHMRIHTGQKPFTCDICKQTFNRKSNMKLHILTHADSKPFVCHVCNSTFSRRYDLNRHKKRKHTGEKPHACDICNFRSVNASYLKTHMENKHLKEPGAKPFACDECDFKCANASYLHLHVKKKHLRSKSHLKKAKIKIKF